MKYIYFPVTEIDAAWQKRANEAQGETDTKSSAEESQAFINSKSAIWRDCKPLLEKLSAGKCWYTEARDKVSYWEVDHYRPKKLYPWLAFDWKNFRLCGGKPNRKKTDEFPLEDEAARASNSADVIADERPLFLDPLKLADTTLLTFKADGESTCAKPQDALAVRRVQETAAAINLDSPILVEERRNKWRKCETALKELRDLVEESRHMATVDATKFSSHLCKELVELFDDKAEFTATAKACAAELGADELIKLAHVVHRQLSPRGT